MGEIAKVDAVEKGAISGRRAPSRRASILERRVMSHSHTELEPMDRDECMKRLVTVQVGRVGITVNALPVILPVNFVLMDEGIFFRTTAGTKLDAATAGSILAFQADAYSPDGAAGWSVLVVGSSSRASDEGRVGALADQALTERWSPARGADHLVKIKVSNVTGRRFGDADNPWLLLH